MDLNSELRKILADRFGFVFSYFCKVQTFLIKLNVAHNLKDSKTKLHNHNNSPNIAFLTVAGFIGPLPSILILMQIDKIA